MRLSFLMLSQCVGVKKSESFIQETISGADLGIFVKGRPNFSMVETGCLLK